MFEPCLGVYFHSSGIDGLVLQSAETVDQGIHAPAVERTDGDTRSVRWPSQVIGLRVLGDPPLGRVGARPLEDTGLEGTSEVDEHSALRLT